MKTLMMFGFAALATTAVFVSRAQTDEVPSGDPFFDGGLDISSEVVELQPARDDLQALRDQYLDAARQRSELMNEEALRQAIAGEEKSVAELHAQKSLDQVEQQLLQITNEFTGTTAGGQAAAMLEHLATLKRQLTRRSDGSMFARDPSGDQFDSGHTFDLAPRADFDDDFDSDGTPSNPVRPPTQPDVAKPRNDGGFFNSPESDANRKSPRSRDAAPFDDRP